MTDKIVVITGATNGIGHATALGLAKKGARIVAVARDQKKAEDLVSEIAKIPGAPKAEIVLADLSEMSQVVKASDQIRTRFDHVDVLINNAAVIYDKYTESKEGLERSYACNSLAPLLLTLSLKPSLAKAPHPRVVIVSSTVHEDAPFLKDYLSVAKPKFQTLKIYAQTKLRNVILTRVLSERWKADGITVNCLHPGVVDTGLMGGLDNVIFKTLFKVVQLFFLSPEKGARTSIFVACDPSLADVTGEYFNECKSVAYNPLADDLEIQKFYWDESNGWLKKAGIDGV
jgi:NAD(P)-dependent dehydrogenase (short-subunit alcohol dehydrogenase family)